MFIHKSKSPAKKLFKEDRKVILKRFIAFLLASIGLFFVNDLSETVDKTTELGTAVAMLVTWLGNAMYLYFKDNGGDNGD